MPQPVFRFAPSPNGYLHLGHALSALLNFDMARAAGGRFLLRMEDIDAARCRPEFEAAIYEDLAWLGLSWEQPVRRQSEHFDEYRAALEKLEAMRLTFPSFESRAEIAHMVGDRDVRERWPRDPDGVPVYPGAARQMKEQDRQARIARGDPYAIRLDMEKATEWAGPAALERNRRGPGRRDRRHRRRSRRLGRRHRRPQGDADQLSPVGRHRRRAAGRDPCGARPGPVLVDQRAPRCCRRCSTCPRRPITITG